MQSAATMVVLRLSLITTLLTSLSVEQAPSELPCVYEGHLLTEKDWYGFLANITVVSTGRMTFRFSYPADKCCQNVLFYLEDQITILNARMNCWQKEGLLRPEDDQILRLTPRFSWSGCHMSHSNYGMTTYVCQGGRSFSSGYLADGPVTWYLAVSNCATLMGLELTYRFEIWGHRGECKSPYKLVTSTQMPVQDVNAVMGNGKMSTLVHDSECTKSGSLNTTDDWYGYIANVSLLRGGGFKFKFTYPYQKQVQNVILYGDEDMDKIRPQLSCWQKEGVIRSRRVPDQILDLSFRSSWNGCVTKNTTQGLMLVCKGERHFNSARKLHIAVNNCRTRTGLALKYDFEFFGFEGDPCSSGSSSVANVILQTCCFILAVIGPQLLLEFNSFCNYR